MKGGGELGDVASQTDTLTLFQDVSCSQRNTYQPVQMTVKIRSFKTETIAKNNNNENAVCDQQKMCLSWMMKRNL